MIALGTRSTADRTRRIQVHSPELHGVKSEWMISDADPVLSPTVFLVEQPAGMVLPAHFHRNNQFQLIVGGAGKIGPAKLQPVTIHYAGANTAYGPLAAGPDGLMYFTIRPVLESGLNIVAETPNADWPAGPRVHATSKPVPIMTVEELRQISVIQTTSGITGDGGLRADIVLLPPGAELLLSPPAAAQGTFAVVLAGSISVAGTWLQVWESAFFSGDEPNATIVAGPTGAQTVMLSVPHLDAAYRS